MPDDARFQLLGAYGTPSVRTGSWRKCIVRGEVRVVGYSDGPIPRPIGYRQGTSENTLIVYGDLAEGDSPGVKPGHRLLVRRLHPGRQPVAAGPPREPRERRNPVLIRATGCDPDRREKISEARTGKRRPRKHMLPAWKADTGRVPTAETRAKLSAASKERAKTFLPSDRAWTATEDEWVRTLAAAEVAARTGRSVNSVYCRRRELNVPDGRTKGERERAGR